MTLQSHISKLWSIIPEKLSGMPQPQTEDLSSLYARGIRAIVSLLEDRIGLDAYKTQGFETLWVPVEDDKAPTAAQVHELVKFVDLQLSQDRPVAIHCKGGRGRTGTMLAGYLIAKGASYESAMNQIEKVQPNAIRQEAQKQFLKEFAAELIAKGD